MIKQVVSEKPGFMAAFSGWGAKEGAGKASVNYLAAIGRYMMAVLFLVSGLHKFFTPSETQALIASTGLPDSAAAYWAIASAEVFGGICLVLGALTRFAAFILAFLTIGVAVALHANFTD
ncbi:MAG: DoxX family protein [Rhodomicrobium sp.]